MSNRKATWPLTTALAAFCAGAAPKLPKPIVPKDNPGNHAKVQLGRYLFYDKRLSVNGTTSCATCHHQELAFTDGRARAVGATGQTHPRSAMSLANLAYTTEFNWSDPAVHSLEEQALKPMMSTSPVELGFNVIEAGFLKTIGTDGTYRPLFRQVFAPEPDPYTVANIARSLAAFERTLISINSPYDRFHFDGDESAISESAKRGEILFFLDGGPSCFRCHSGFNFSDATESLGGVPAAPLFHNTGLYNIPGLFSYPAPNRGLYEHTRRTADMGKFKAPTLRNIEVTAPYMHDGSIATLEEVIDHYAAGGRTVADGPQAGVGHDNANKDKLVRGFRLTAQNRADLVAFLKSLTDAEFLSDPKYSDPWPGKKAGK